MSVKYKSDEEFTDIEIKDLLSTFFVTLLVTRACNAKCTYCDVIYESTGKPMKSRIVNQDEFDKVLEFIDFQDSPFRPNLNLSFFGGEPTINPNLNHFIEKSHIHFKGKRNLDLQMTSNLIKPIEYFVDLGHVRTAASLHTEQIKESSTEWFKKVNLLHERNMLQHVVMMLTKSNIDEIIQLYKEYADQFKCIVVPIDQFMSSDEYETMKRFVCDELGTNPFEHDEEKFPFFDQENELNKELGH